MQAHEARIASEPMPTIAGVASFVGTFVGVILLIVGLLAFDLFLARVDLRESSRHADSEYRRGLALLDSNQPSQAADRFAAALAISRDNVNYALALGEAQRRGGKATDAEATLRGLLERAENDGAVNLAMARVLAGEGRVGEAQAFFHRAIYGRWGADSSARRAEARFALIDLLAANGGGRDLLAELLPLEDVSPDSVALRMRLGRWFLLAGSPVRAANMFREVLRRDPQDGGAFAGMGEAAMAQGNFRTARADFAQAVQLSPEADALVARLALTDTLLAADPTARDLDPIERMGRAKALLGRMLTALSPCIAQTSNALADSARTVIADTVAKSSHASADDVIAVAGALWSASSPACRSAASDSIVALLAVRLPQ